MMPGWSSATTWWWPAAGWSAPPPRTSSPAGTPGCCCATGATRDGRPTPGAGILSPDTTERDDPAWVALCRLAGAHYDTLIPNLAGDTGWARCGILKLATRDSDVPAFEWTAARAPAATEITPDEARAMVPVLGRREACALARRRGTRRRAQARVGAARRGDGPRRRSADGRDRRRRPRTPRSSTVSRSQPTR